MNAVPAPSAQTQPSSDITQALRADAARLLEEGRVKLVVGHRAMGAERPAVFVADAGKTAELVHDSSCRQNLAAYLFKPEIRSRLPVAIVASPAVCRSLLLLASESQLRDEDVLALAVGEDCYHGALDIPGVRTLLQERYAELAPEPALLDRIAGLLIQKPAQRAAFWLDQARRCTRCYACRAACPNCYCRQCIAEKNMPQWVPAAPTPYANFSWMLMRAFHQAGRCTGCGACEAACPQGLPLMLLNAKLSQDSRELFGCRPGYDPAAEPMIGTWRAEDDDSFML